MHLRGVYRLYKNRQLRLIKLKRCLKLVLKAIRKYRIEEQV